MIGVSFHGSVQVSFRIGVGFHLFSVHTESTNDQYLQQSWSVRPVSASAYADQSLRCPHEETMNGSTHICPLNGDHRDLIIFKAISLGMRKYHFVDFGMYCLKCLKRWSIAKYYSSYAITIAVSKIDSVETNLLLAWYFYSFLTSADIFQNYFFQNNLSESPSECQTVWI